MVDRFNKCLAHDVVAYVTRVMMEDPRTDLEAAVKIGRDRKYTAYCVTHDATAAAAAEVDGLVRRVIDAVQSTRWYTKHKEVADLVATAAVVAWEPTETGASILMVDGTPRKKSTAVNAELYAAYRLVHHRSAALCAAAGIGAVSGPPAVAVTKLQMHWEKTYTPSVFKAHGEILYKALHTLIRKLK